MTTQSNLEEQVPSADKPVFDDLRQVLVGNNFTKAIDEFDTELSELQALYNKVKAHTMGFMDAMENGTTQSGPRRLGDAPAKPRVSSVYISSQITNLISLKNLTNSVRKSKNDLTQTTLDRAFKVITQITKDQREAQGGGDLPYDAILSYLMNAGITIPVSIGAQQNAQLLSHVQSETDVDSELLNVIEVNGLVALPTNGETLSNPVVEDEESVDNELPTLNTQPDEEYEDPLASASAIYFDEDEGRLYIIRESGDIIKEISEDDVELEEQEDGTVFCTNLNLPVITE